MIKEDGSDNYSSSNSIPVGDYILNEEKTFCENGGKVKSYNNRTGQIGFSFLGSDRCSLYFDYKESLYHTIENRYNQDKTYLGLYTGEGADTYANPVYYYKGNVQNNNVLFGGFCWKIVRTTETGGVKIVYNGVQKDFYESTLLNESEYKNLSNDANYPYTFDSTNKTWTSTNTEENSSTITFTAPSNGNYVLNYDLSMYNYRNSIYVEIFKDDVSQGEFTGITTGQIIFDDLDTTNIIKVVFTREYSYTSGSRNNVIFSFGKANSIIKTCNNEKIDSQIGESAFNSSYDSPAYVGYMYNNIYNVLEKKIVNRFSAPLPSVFGANTQICVSDSISYGLYSDGLYTLNTLPNDSDNIISYSNRSSAVGKYTCRKSSCFSNSCTEVYYIAGYNESANYFYSYPLVNGDVDGTDNDTDYVFGKSFTFENGSYTLSDTTVINTNDFFNDSDSVLNVNTYHYSCLTDGSTCSSLYYIFNIADVNIYYITLTGGKSVNDALNEMLYADDVNTKDSTIKAYIDDWYENNLASYEDRLEDTVFCNDRSMSNESSNGWNPNGGSTSTILQFKNFSTSNQSLVCANETDRFSMSNAKAKLKHPIGLLSVPELSLAGYESSHYFNNQNAVWLGSPNSFGSFIIMLPSYIAEELRDNSYVNYASSNGLSSGYSTMGVRPSISLKPGIMFFEGDGSYTSPFVIE